MKRPKKSQHQLIDDILFGQDYGAFDSPLGKALLRSWSLGVRDETVVNLIKSQVHSLRQKELFGRLVPFKSANLDSGEIILGKDFSGKVLFLKIQSLTVGLLLCANTGSGKTTLLFFWLPQIVAQGISVWISDMYKTHLRKLRPLFKRAGSDLIILRPQNWKFNLLQPGLIDPQTHLTMVVDLIIRTLGLPSRARSILRQACHALYQKFGIWAGSKTGYPTLFDLYEWIKSEPKLNAQARDSILDRLGSYLISLTPKCGAYRLGWTATDLSKFCIDFEMVRASEQVKQLFLEPLLFNLLNHEYQLGSANRKINLFIAFEDSQRFFDSGNQGEDSAITPMAELAGVIRGGGKGLGAIIQTLNGFAPKMIPNLGNKFMGRLGSFEDYDKMGAHLGLNPGQKEWAKLNLQPGTFIGQLADGACRHPFAFQVPLIRINETIDDVEAGESLKPLESLKTEFAAEFASWDPYGTVEVTSSPLTPAELKFLEAVVANPGQPSRVYAKMAGINGSAAKVIRSTLISQGYLREFKVVRGGVGRPASLLEPLKKAENLIGGAK